MERDILAFWREHRSFEKLVAKNRGRSRWSFIDGPITANNPMGVHHAWGRTYKDLYQRYHAMLGFDQRYQNGFDGQGLWIEVEVERQLGFTSKRDIEEFGVDRFVELCRERVRRFSDVQTQQSIRLGYWMDWDNSYQTMSDENNYTIWAFLKRCHERGLIYKGQDVMPWCPRCSTGLSNMEIVTEGYQELTHRSIYLKFPIIGRARESLLVWTTTPWTLSSNVAAAVHPELAYLRVRQDDQVVIVSKGALGAAIAGPFEVVEEVRGADLVGLAYRGPFDELDPQHGIDHRVVAWDLVSESEGTGIVHIAPGCGAEDFALARELGLPSIAPIDEFGVFLPGFGWLTGQKSADVVADVIEDLDQKGILYRTQDYTHRYPVCWRCGTELVFRLVDEWYISMDGPRRPNAPDARPTLLRDEIAEITRQIEWIPDFGMERELDWLKNMDDWMISKKRYYGLALPIFDCAHCGNFEVIGSETELESRAISGWDQFVGHSPHRPWVDHVKIACGTCAEPLNRIPDVGNAWLDAGIVPFSTLGYRHGSPDWEKWFPADFITESFPGQFRNWFYALLAQSTVMAERAPFRTCFGYALLRDEHGEDMHKSKGNSIPFDEAAEKAGADILRWMYCRTNPAQNMNFGYGIANEVRRRLLTLWNVYSFFVTYARLDGFSGSASRGPSRPSSLDRWVLGRLNRLIRSVRAALDRYDAMTAARDIEQFVEDLSNWYVRRGRRRYWKSEADEDKAAAYTTLHHVLVTFAEILAPFQPFLAEVLYQNLVRSVDSTAPESVHHRDYPTADETFDDPGLEARMERVLRVVNLGRAARSRSGIKVRQPLGRLLVCGVSSDDLTGLEDEVLDELNVRAIEFLDAPDAISRVELRPVISRLGPKHGSALRAIQAELANLDAESAARLLRAGEPIQVAGHAILPDEIELRTHDREGLCAAAEGDVIVAVDTRLTPRLVDEGHAREIVHHIQTMRRTADYRIDDRITVSFSGAETALRVFAEHDAYIRGETLATAIEPEISPSADFVEEVALQGEKVRLAVRR